MASEQGQASVEYLGVVAVVGVLLAALAVPALAGRDVAGAVVAEVRRALCIVAGGQCWLDRRPCVVASSQVTDDGSVDFAIIRIGSRVVVLRQDRSDGTVAVTFLRDRLAGLDLTAGGGAQLRVGRTTLRLGTQAEATVLAMLGSGTTWVLRDARAADRLVRGLVVDGAGDLGRRVLHGGRPDTRGAPAPAWSASRRGLAVTLVATTAGAGHGGALRLGSEDLAGVATQHATGRRTFVVRRRNDLVGSITRGQSDVLGGAGAVDELYTVTVDRVGRPLDLGVLRGGEVGVHIGGPAPLRALRGARRWEAEEHLDLSDPENLAAARDFLREVVAPRPRLGAAVAVSAALRRRLDEAGVLDVRAYALSGVATGIGVAVGTGVGHLGAGYERRRQRLRLVGAAQRGPEGLWRARGDCTRGVA